MKSNFCTSLISVIVVCVHVTWCCRVSSRVSIPKSTVDNVYKIKPHTRKSFEPCDSMALAHVSEATAAAVFFCYYCITLVMPLQFKG